MNYTQNTKIMQVSEKTLVIGVDIAKETQFARAFDFRGIELGKVFSFESTEEGFKKFNEWTKEIATTNKKEAIIVGMEPTGHYWFTFAQFVKENDMRVVLVNPFHVKRSKELDDNSRGKNDRKDPKTIAMLIKDGRFSEPYIPEGVYSDLRIAIDTRDLINKELSIVQNRANRWLDIFFPEFTTVFSDWEGKAAIITLKNFPTPGKILEKSVEDIIIEWKKEIKGGIGIKHAERLYTAAKHCVGMKEGIEMAEIQIRMIIETYEHLKKQLNELDSKIEELLKKIPSANELLKIKGIGILTVAVFISEIGDIARFETPDQIQKLAGLGLAENSSGKHKGKTTIEKRGRKKLRCALFKGIMPVVANNPEFKELHKYYTTRQVNPLKKKQSLIALCSKLIRIFFVILSKGVEYDAEKMMRDIKRVAAA